VLLLLPAVQAAWAQTATAFKVPVEHFTLPNGLKVVVSEDHTSPVAVVEVMYNIGFRSEPKGRTGFAHLFEHMMFQGSGNVKKMEHVSLMQQAGGVVNGSTRLDYTNYFQVLPSNAVELALWLEADRMRSLDVSAENLKNQQNVVSEEVRVNVLNQPHAAFEWLDIWQRANVNWNNAHNFYGDLADLEAATLEDVRTFFKTYYAPNNAVLVVVGDVNPAEIRKFAEKHFGDIPRQTLPAPSDDREPPQTEEKRHARGGQARPHAGPRGGVAPAAAHDQGLLRLERARPAHRRRRKRAAVSEAGASGPARHVGDRRLQLPGQQLGRARSDALHASRRLPQ
jgi:predicted Zn-dependent peptidase